MVTDDVLLCQRSACLEIKSIGERSNILWRFGERGCSNRQSAIIWGSRVGQIVI